MEASFSSPAVSATSDIRGLPLGAFGRIGALLRATYDRLRRWQLRRETVAALECLTDRDLRDIGLVRFTDAGPTTYAHMEDWQ